MVKQQQRYHNGGHRFSAPDFTSSSATAVAAPMHFSASAFAFLFDDDAANDDVIRHNNNSNNLHAEAMATTADSSAKKCRRSQSETRNGRFTTTTTMLGRFPVDSQQLQQTGVGNGGVASSFIGKLRCDGNNKNIRSQSESAALNKLQMQQQQAALVFAAGRQVGSRVLNIDGFRCGSPSLTLASSASPMPITGTSVDSRIGHITGHDIKYFGATVSGRRDEGGSEGDDSLITSSSEEEPLSPSSPPLCPSPPLTPSTLYASSFDVDDGEDSGLSRLTLFGGDDEHHHPVMPSGCNDHLYEMLRGLELDDNRAKSRPIPMASTTTACNSNVAALSPSLRHFYEMTPPKTACQALVNAGSVSTTASPPQQQSLFVGSSSSPSVPLLLNAIVSAATAMAEREAAASVALRHDTQLQATNGAQQQGHEETVEAATNESAVFFDDERHQSFGASFPKAFAPKDEVEIHHRAVAAAAAAAAMEQSKHPSESAAENDEVVVVDGQEAGVVRFGLFDSSTTKQQLQQQLDPVEMVAAFANTPTSATDAPTKFHTFPAAVNSSNGNKKCVRFADDCGQSLETIKVMSEPSDYPPSLPLSLLRRYKKAAAMFNAASQTLSTSTAGAHDVLVSAANLASVDENADDEDDEYDDDEGDEGCGGEEAVAQKLNGSSRSLRQQTASASPTLRKKQSGEGSSWMLAFKQPASDYVRFRHCLDTQKVALENVMLKNEVGRMVGTIKVANVAFEKNVFIRFTVDNWCSYMDRAAQYQSSPSRLFDTFRFDVELPRNTRQDSRVEFCVGLVAGACGSSGHFWDNNDGRNWVLTSPKPDPLSAPCVFVRSHLAALQNANKGDANKKQSFVEQQIKAASRANVGVKPSAPNNVPSSATTPSTTQSATPLPQQHQSAGWPITSRRALDRNDAYMMECSPDFASWRDLSTNNPYW